MRIPRPTRRTTVRVAATTVAGAGVLLAGASTASAALVDTNGDGRGDQHQLETNGDEEAR